MRELTQAELDAVTGGTYYCPCYCPPPTYPPAKGNNGVGNGLDPQPPGNPPPNDLAGTSPGNPGNQGGA
jgi:hypothetical protein